MAVQCRTPRIATFDTKMSRTEANHSKTVCRTNADIRPEQGQHGIRYLRAIFKKTKVQIDN